MDSSNESLLKPDKQLTAVCGLFCPACHVFIGTNEDPERLKALAGIAQLKVEELECHGCRSEKRSYFCKEKCKIAKCAADKGIDFCGVCAEYPCTVLKEFQAQMPHRIELWKSQERIREVGYEKWYAEMLEHYSCTKCGTLNSAYDVACRKCGATPSCTYADQHKEEIMPFITRMKA